MIVVLASAFGLGVAFSVPPGPVFAEGARRGLARGFRAMFVLELGSLVGDAAWAAVALTGAALAIGHGARVVLGVIGTALLLWLAIRAMLDARTPHAAPVAAPRRGGDFTTGALVSLASPWAVAFWIGIGAAAASLIGTPSPSKLAAFFIAFLAGSMAWATFVTVLVAGMRRVLPAGAVRWMHLAGGAALAAFAVRLGAGVVSDAVR